MKIRIWGNILLGACVLLLCTGVLMYLYTDKDLPEPEREVDLYALVPQDAVVLLETSSMSHLVNEINQMECSRDGHFLNFSQLFNYLKKYLNSMADNLPHGISREMNRVMLSMHQPDIYAEQVLYCGLGDGDPDLLRGFVDSYYEKKFATETRIYRKERIVSYQLPDNSRMAVWFTSDFFVASFSERMMERVIDAWKEQKSLQQRGFPILPRVESLRKASARIHMYTDKWLLYDLVLEEGVIHCSGINAGVDARLVEKAQKLMMHNEVNQDIMFLDMEEVVTHPGIYRGLLPNYLFVKGDFFRRFFLEVDFTYIDSMAYPNLRFLYKSR